MIAITPSELIDNSFIGKHLELTTDSEKTFTGYMNSISPNEISIIDDFSMASVSFQTQHITRMSFGERTLIDKQYAIKFKNKHSHDADVADLTLVGRFASRLEEFMTNCNSDVLRRYISSELSHRAASIYPPLLNSCLDEIKCYEYNRNVRLINILLQFRLRNFAECASILHQALNDPEEDCAALICACFFAQCKNGISAYFWLTQYFLQSDDTSYIDSDLWWYYLKGCVTYSSYEHLDEITGKISDPLKIIESYAFIHALNNNTIRAIQLIDLYVNSPQGVDQHLFDLGSWLLLSDPDNHYHRYLRCVASIVGNNELNANTFSNEMQGYIYDYIPDKGYGFILGTDLLSYFFFKDSIVASSVMEDIKSNICAFLSVEEERLVNVSFTRSEQTKRTYSATNIF